MTSPSKRLISKGLHQKILMMPMEASAVIGSLGGLAEIAKEAFLVNGKAK